ncbi:RAxF-45 family protein [Bacillus ndiopicus]|nr:RAxF-45 family protein [Bacillus ndiopicus]
MIQNAMMTGVKVDTAMYFARVITFDFAPNGISLPFFKQIKIRNVAD